MQRLAVLRLNDDDRAAVAAFTRRDLAHTIDAERAAQRCIREQWERQLWGLALSLPVQCLPTSAPARPRIAPHCRRELAAAPGAEPHDAPPTSALQNRARTVIRLALLRDVTQSVRPGHSRRMSLALCSLGRQARAAKPAAGLRRPRGSVPRELPRRLRGPSLREECRAFGRPARPSAKVPRLRGKTGGVMVCMFWRVLSSGHSE